MRRTMVKPSTTQPKQQPKTHSDPSGLNRQQPLRPNPLNKLLATAKSPNLPRSKHPLHRLPLRPTQFAGHPGKAKSGYLVSPKSSARTLSQLTENFKGG